MPDDTTPAGGTHRQLGLGTAGLIERSITLLMVVVLLVGVLAILKPFAAAILFGATLAIAAWPLRQWMIGRGVGPRLTAALLLLLSLLVIVLPALIMAPVLTDELKAFTESVENYFAATPQRPGWIENVPLIGGKLAAAWDGLLEAKGDVATALAPQSEILQRWLITAARALGDSVVQMILALIVATMFCINGSKLVEELDNIVVRLGGATAHASLLAAAGAVRSVSYGVIGTALAQAALLVLGLALAGVPGATTLGFVGLLLSISQIGAPLLVLIWGGAAWWLFGQGQVGWGSFMVAWGILVSMVDNVLKPWLIGRGIRMPMPLTILGVFGGFIAFGFLGLFIGPTLLAVAFVLLQAWRTSPPG
ncbi:AI-2E family transporter [Rhizobium sp. IBUN]|uniref:AI-2E family transporter n=1 Tax=Rhizobium sp. IBUN TaxID=1042326 RepID=UPI00040CD653|nr:AI-2E family transporter [Rhizobium sp. IBUN]